MSAAEAKALVLQAINGRFRADKISARRVSFQDLARSDAYVVTISGGWTRGPIPADVASRVPRGIILEWSRPVESTPTPTR